MTFRRCPAHLSAIRFPQSEIRYLSIFFGNLAFSSLLRINCCRHLNVILGLLGSQPFGFGRTAASMADCSRVSPRAVASQLVVSLAPQATI